MYSLSSYSTNVGIIFISPRISNIQNTFISNYVYCKIYDRKIVYGAVILTNVTNRNKTVILATIIFCRIFLHQGSKFDIIMGDIIQSCVRHDCMAMNWIFEENGSSNYFYFYKKFGLQTVAYLYIIYVYILCNIYIFPLS